MPFAFVYKQNLNSPTVHGCMNLTIVLGMKGMMKLVNFCPACTASSIKASTKPVLELISAQLNTRPNKPNKLTESRQGIVDN